MAEPNGPLDALIAIADREDHAGLNRPEQDS